MPISDVLLAIGLVSPVISVLLIAHQDYYNAQPKMLYRVPAAILCAIWVGCFVKAVGLHG